MSKALEHLSDGHWTFEDFRQWITVRSWRAILLAGQHEIMFRGHLRRLVARPLGAGVVEVSKAPEESTKPDKAKAGCRSCSGLRRALSRAVGALETNAMLWAEFCPQGARQSAATKAAQDAVHAGRRALARWREDRK